MISSEHRKKALNLCYSLGAIGVFNVVLQLIVYPFLERHMGAEPYGIALSVLSLIAILNGACGYAAGCARLLGIERGYCENGDYNLVLLIMGMLCGIVGIGYLSVFGLLTPLGALLYLLLSFATMLRFYSEVEFRARVDFFGFMIYYLLISLGYIVGLLFLKLSNQWMLVFITGEALCLAYVVAKGRLLRPPFFERSPHLGAVMRSIWLVLLSTLIENVALHSDRILLLSITRRGSDVTTYYIASLIGKVIALLTSPINALLLSYLVRYRGTLSKKRWRLVLLAAILLGALALGVCLWVSPHFVRLLYPQHLQTVSPYLLTAILGQVLYFISSVLTTILLRFKGEKKLLLFNAAYAIEFFTVVILATRAGGLLGFARGVVLANALRLVGAAIWGYLPSKRTSEA